MAQDESKRGLRQRASLANEERELLRARHVFVVFRAERENRRALVKKPQQVWFGGQRTQCQGANRQHPPSR